MNPLHRFPKASQVASVYAIIVLMVYSWTILWFFWKLPSWLYFMQVGEIFQVFFITIATAFGETLLVLAFPISLSILLPGKWFYDSFVVRGSSLVILCLAYLMLFDFQFQEEAYPKLWLFFTPIVLLVIFFLVYLSKRISFIARMVESIANRAVVMLYISLPVSILSVLIILFMIITNVV